MSTIRAIKMLQESLLRLEVERKEVSEHAILRKVQLEELEVLMGSIRATLEELEDEGNPILTKEDAEEFEALVKAKK